jgi:hypothetical protein
MERRHFIIAAAATGAALAFVDFATEHVAGRPGTNSCTETISQGYCENKLPCTATKACLHQRWLAGERALPPLKKSDVR